MMKQKSLYGNIFTYASLQFCGNVEEYFSKHAKKLVVFIVMPRLKNKNNLIRTYKEGRLVKEEKIKLSENILGYYFVWYITYIKIIFTYFSSKEKIICLGFHPISFFAMSFQKLVRRITFVFWIGDYFPPTTLPVRIYEAVKRFYHERVKYTCYLGDGINRKMNGKILDSTNHKTVMWGVKPKNLSRKLSQSKFTILFVGVIKESQGLEHIFSFLKENKDCFINIIGICDPRLFAKYKTIIKKYQIEKQVYFPNRFFDDNDVNVLSQKSHVGIALYDVDSTNPTYYTDPGKVKAYIEMGLPVIMSDVSAVSPFIKKFKAGVVINQDSNALQEAIVKIKRNYKIYEVGVKKFVEYFNYESYYKEKFKFLERI